MGSGSAESDNGRRVVDVLFDGIWGPKTSSSNLVISAMYHGTFHFLNIGAIPEEGWGAAASRSAGSYSGHGPKSAL